MYVAAVLYPEAAQVLKRLVLVVLKDSICVDLISSGWLFETPTGGELPHHMTINMGPLDETLNPPSILDQEVSLRVSHIYYDPILGACAVAVNSAWRAGDAGLVQSKNDQPHITVALKPGVKPKVSNDLFGPRRDTTVKLLFDGLTVKGTIKLCD